MFTNVMYFGLLWPWPLTSWPPKLNISCHCRTDHICQFASKLVHSLSKMFTSSIMNEWMNGRVRNIIPRPTKWRTHN